MGVFGGGGWKVDSNIFDAYPSSTAPCGALTLPQVKHRTGMIMLVQYFLSKLHFIENNKKRDGKKKKAHRSIYLLHMS